MAKQATGRERRRYPRADIHVPAVYRMTADEQSGMAVTVVENISEGGVLLAMSELAAPEIKVQLEFSFPGGEQKIIANGQITRLEPGILDQVGRLAVKFTDISDEDRQRIADIVNLAKGEQGRASA